MTPFAKKLKEFRKEHGLTQAQLAHELGVDPSRISHWEHDELPPTYIVERISTAYGVNAFAWFKADAPNLNEAPLQRSPRLVHMHTTTPRAEDADGNWRSKAVDVLNRITRIIEDILGGSRGGGGVSKPFSGRAASIVLTPGTRTIVRWR